jgi:UDP-GlcNAc3NAcA epimerase
MNHIITIIGTRPQFIKAAPVSQVFNNNGINELIIDTGQHYDFNMSEIFIKELNIPKPKFNLNIGSKSHAQQTGEIISKLEPIILNNKPKAILVYGDTNSTLGAAITASKLNIPLIHIEAGLRSFNKAMPEEINRIITDHMSNLLFCPSKNSQRNLKNETINNNSFVVGDVMFDIFKKFYSYFDSHNKYGDYALLTMHREENTVSRILIKRLNQFSKLKMKFIYPLHPRTKKIITQENIRLPNNIITIEPIGWLDLMKLANNAKFIITDSGGLQKEALWLKKYCITIRNETEWIETIEQGVNQLNTINNTLTIPNINKGNFSNPYGDGKASKKITEIIKTTFNI